MNNSELLKNISFNLSHVAHCRLNKEWDYKNIISSFTRLYLITDGEGYIFMGEQKIKLRKGYLYLIPSFVHCTYLCEDYMEQYYATFTIHLPNDLSIYQLFNFKNEIKARPLHFEFFKQLYEVNPGMELPTSDPLAYQKKSLSKLISHHKGAKCHLLTSGLLSLFISDFIDTTQMDLETETHSRISSSIAYIHKNLNKDLTVKVLSERACVSSDYFTKQFKHLTKQNPIDYINRQRIEKAQFLLNTSTYTISEIGECCGFKSITYFCRTFKKYVKQTPNDFRNNSFS